MPASGKPVGFSDGDISLFMSLSPTSICKPPASHPQHRSDKEFRDFLTVVDHITKAKPSSKGKHRSGDSSYKFNPVVHLSSFLLHISLNIFNYPFYAQNGNAYY